ncbi:hypothetical protein [Acinetobacter sp. CFCC 10889]|uniref:hypothetical protein n=1 Tax=Acinetobacter sp. CFCC 10889 TaxID=1775557 RepID=UPI000DCFE558|nr:hypothetical protein [Acinetobacter sp. CFCC 10889]
MMQKQLMISLIIFSLFACSDVEKNKVDPELEKIALPDTENDKATEVNQQLTFEDIPNQQTRYETIEANNINENEVLMNALQAQLLKQHFELFESESGRNWSENDCNLNKVIQVKGEGLRIYIAKSKVGIGEKKNYFPDFTMLVFGFDDEAQATQHFTTLKSAVFSNHGFCNGKTPENIVRNGNEVFYFTTRAEMFRGYINESANFIQNYKSTE